MQIWKWICSLIVGSLLLMSAYRFVIVPRLTLLPTAPSSLHALPGEDVPILTDTQHIPAPFFPHHPYTSVPPTSGPHVAQTVAPGIYREEIPEEVQVHALEHGRILIQYAPNLPTSQIRLLEQIGRSYPADVIVAPCSRLHSGLALTAWGRLLRMDQPDQAEIRTFIMALRGRYDHGWKR